tara:strand:+ start:513 stop:770 length:258 start_codon:yes stop_codon:yes gene_type:complete
MTNNTNTKGNVMKCFDVTYVCPWSGREVTSIEVSANRIYQNDSGEMVFHYNDFYPACEVVTACEVPQSRLDAKMAYFKRYGTACE